MKVHVILSLIVAYLLCSCNLKSSVETQSTALNSQQTALNSVATIPTRTFSMGFTPYPHSQTDLNAQSEAWKRIASNGDLVVIHKEEGIPWQAAYEGRFGDYPPSVLQKISAEAEEILQLPSSTEIFLYTTFLDGSRTALAPFRDSTGEVNPAPFPWNSKSISFNDPMVINAYV